MIVHKVLVEEYRDDGRGREPRWLVNPTWEQMEQAIRSLDRFRRPFVWLYLSEAAQDGDVPEFEIIGGGGAYAMQATVNGDRLMYRDPAKGDRSVDAWTSDQGALVPEENVCSDIDAVLAIARHFCETGDLPASFERC